MAKLWSHSWEKYLPDPELEVVEDNLHEFWYWVNERQNIYYNRFILKKPQPWTANRLLADYKFTNVYRELDRNSVFVIENIVNNTKLTEKEKVFQIIIFRLFNRPETFTAIGGVPRLKGFTGDELYKKMKTLVDKNIFVFTQAYMITPSVCKENMIRWEYYSKIITQFVYNNIDSIYNTIKQAETPQAIIKELKRIPGVSDFISFEFFSDFEYVEGLMKFDRNSFVNIGPGAMMGLRLLFPKKSMEGLQSCVEIVNHLTAEQEFYFDMYMIYNFKYLDNKYKRLTLREIEHSLCEYQKYWKLKNNLGKQRMEFKPISKVS
jgi:hypothetical protein